jgi:pSer/pThr/pTyr-binding forkhead associated (FHA) protein
LTVFCTRCGHPNRDDARFCAECGASLQADATLSLTPVEGEDEGHDEFPFPHDELEPGQSLLLVKRGPNAGSTFLLEAGSTAVGRSTDSAVFLDDITVSRAHAVLERRDDGSWFVRDVGSLNGTYVNGEQVDETKLASGDEVQIGKFKLTFFAAGE